MSIPKFSVRRPVTVVMILLIVFLLGIVSVTSLKTDLFPNMNLPYVVISTSYDGAGPEQVEMMVTKPTEGAMATVSNIKSIESMSTEGNSVVIMEFSDDTDMDSAILDIRESLDLINGYMPAEVGSPIILKINPDMMPIQYFSISVDGMNLTEASMWIEDEIVPNFERIEGVAQVNVMGASEDQVHIQIDNEALLEKNKELAEEIYGMVFTEDEDGNYVPEVPEIITADSIKGIIMGQHFSMPSGYVVDGEYDYMVRVGDELKSMEDFENLSVYYNEEEEISVALSEVADVSLEDTSKDTYTYVNGEKAIMLSIQKQTTFATTEVVEKVNQEITDLENEYGDDIKIEVIMDQAEYIDMAVGTVKNNLIYGAILAIIILFIFLRNLRPTFIVGVAIPISLFAAFAMMYFLKIDLNIVSMGGLALGIGMLVDNAIVVIENIYRMRSEGKSVKKAAVQGAKQVAGAITASTLTTVSVFLPIVFMSGFTAEIFKEMALTISCSLLASLFIALTFVPMASSKLLTKKPRKESKGLKKFKKAYEESLKTVLKAKTLFIILAIGLFAASIYGAMQVGVEYMPDSDTGQISVTVDMPDGSTFEDTAEMMDKLSEIAMRIEGVDTVGATIGGDMFMGLSGGDSGTGNLYILVDENSSRKTMSISQELREDTDHLDCKIEISDQAMDPAVLAGGSGISIEVRGPEFDILEDIASDVAEIVDTVDGTTEIENGIDKDAPEIKVEVNKDKALENGLTVAQVYSAIDEVVDPNNKITTINDDSREYDVLLLDDTKVIHTKEELENLELQNAFGETILVSDIADVYFEEGYTTITRTDQERVLTVTAKLKNGYNIGLVSKDIEKELKDYEVPEGYAVEIAGENEMIMDALQDLGIVLLLAVLLIYMIMAAQFESLKYPLIIMSCIPLAFTGGFIALIATSNPISIISAIGFIVLVGVVVNNGIVMVDYTNKLKEKGMHYTEAVIKAGKTRIRPIIMTALTTIFALSTMAVGVGRGAEMMQPLAITAIGGLLYSTLLTLFIIPAIYSLMDQSVERRKERKAFAERNMNRKAKEEKK
ncbi:MAG: efflux RND transporter permease subunit [Clostridia bacterium]|nr:efflux RND transporter permease subunit [Clostridia bacterium]